MCLHLLLRMKRAVVLMNLGSPDSTEVRDVKKYLDEFLMDERVIDKPFLLRALLVRGIIIPFRAPKSAEAYRSIWTKEGSPLIVITKQLQFALQQQVDEPVEIAMRYGTPSPAAAFDALMTKVKGLENNSRFVNLDNRIFVQATKNIPAHTEILVEYGDGYWDTVRQNRRLKT